MNIKVKVEREFDDEFVSDILIAAFDGMYGGSWYWAKPFGSGGDWLTVKQEVKSDTWTSVKIQAQGDDDGQSIFGRPDLDALNEQSFVVDSDVLQKGIQKILDDYPAGSRIRGYVMQAVLDGDAGAIDSEAADSILQVGLFGEEIFA